MSHEVAPVDETVTVDELTEFLVEGTTPNEIEREAETFDITPAEEADVVGE